jgi:predicted nucleic acid-binding protein
MAGPAVMDSSALIFAFRLPGILQILKGAYSHILIPNAVYDEVVVEGRRLGKEEVGAIQDEVGRFIRVERSDESLPVEPDPRLGKGELEVISLALKKGAEAIIDDRRARIFGARLSVRIIPLASLLVIACGDGTLKSEEAAALLDDLVQAGYRLRSDTYIEVRKRLLAP